MNALCECGCGQPAPIARATDNRKGIVKGQPLRFIHGHNSRLQKKQEGCQVDGCKKPFHSHGYCAMHAARVRKYGTPSPPTWRTDPIAAFWLRVDKHGPVPTFRPDLGPCWIWTGRRQEEGYGRFGVRELTPSGTKLAHRAAYELTVGPIPDGLHLDHLCRVPACVNPSHLEPVTVKENTRRGLNGVLRTHCSAGHELTEENTYLRASDNSRHCRTCRREQAAMRRKNGNKNGAVRAECAHGHALVGDNIKWNGKIAQCRECARRHAREYARRKRAEAALAGSGVHS